MDITLNPKGITKTRIIITSIGVCTMNVVPPFADHGVQKYTLHRSEDFLILSFFAKRSRAEPALRFRPLRSWLLWLLWLL